jgi:hypothetical protein
MDIDRRGVFKRLSVGVAGIAVAVGTSRSSAVSNEGGQKMKEELARLKEAYEMLDARTKLVVKLVLTATGIDFLSDAALIFSEQ